MTAKTQLPGLCIQKILVLSGMGRMAGKAAFFTCDGCVVKWNLPTFIFMAIDTEIINFFGNELRILRGMG